MRRLSQSNAAANSPPPTSSDGAGAKQTLKALGRRWPWLTHLFANFAARGMAMAAFLDFALEVRCIDTQSGCLLRRIRH
jgi:hypothetical protein